MKTVSMSHKIMRKRRNFIVWLPNKDMRWLKIILDGFTFISMKVCHRIRLKA